MKKLLSLVVAIMMVLNISLVVFSQNEQKNQVYDVQKMDFTDITNEHWAYNAIKFMVEREILKGYPDRTFKPNKEITRAEFSTIMVKSFNLKIQKPEKAFFVDVDKNHWAFSFIETSKQYLTGFRTAIGDYYRPSLGAVREDMAVALVKGLELENKEYAKEILNKFSDSNSISENLRGLVSIAVESELIKGYPVDSNGKRLFKAQGTLTRGEAAVLIFKALGMEKVSYGSTANSDKGTKVTYDDSHSAGNDGYALGTTIKGYMEKEKITLKWNPVPSNKFKYYKIVISRNDSTPKYPENGWLYYISDVNKTYAYVDNSKKYNNGDFGGYLENGETYYFNITAVYEGTKVPSNTISLKYSGNMAKTYKEESCDVDKIEDNKMKTPSFTNFEQRGDYVYINWMPTIGTNFKYYKVVLSKYNKTPSYPKDGYLTYISEYQNSSFKISGKTNYNGGDFGGKTITGEKYYVAITAVYNDGKYTSNVKEIILP